MEKEGARNPGGQSELLNFLTDKPFFLLRAERKERNGKGRSNTTEHSRVIRRVQLQALKGG